MSFGETIFLFFLALIIFGPKKLPEIARTVGKYLNEFKRASNEFKAQIEQEISNLDTAKPQILPPSLNSSSFAGDSHTTETLAPEGTASRSLTSGNDDSVKADSVNVESTEAIDATLAAPALPIASTENSYGNAEGNIGESAIHETAAKGSASSPNPTDAVTNGTPQESHA